MRAVLIACGDDADLDRSLEELAQLVRAAGALPIGSLVQRHAAPDGSFYLGRGKSEELRDVVCHTRADLIVADDELTPVQRRNLERVTGVAVLDRTHVILDIFARRARSREGKLQVELAQLSYLLPRLTGWGQTLSRLGGGIGTRGPGETKLEADRRRIKRRIAQLRRQIEDLRRHRQQQRRGRSMLELPTVVLVGYTNSGKSTLLNALSGSQVSARDRPFETLDPTVRRVYLGDGLECLMTDTVGFIRKLPAHLVAAFRATLEEVAQASLLVHVVDASAPDVAAQMQAVFETLEVIGAAARPTVLALNKIDRAEGGAVRALMRDYPGAVAISALHGTNLDQLRSAIAGALPDARRMVELEVPYSEAGLVAQVYRKGRVMAQQCLPHAIRLRASMAPSVLARLQAAGARVAGPVQHGGSRRGKASRTAAAASGRMGAYFAAGEGLQADGGGASG